MEKDLHKRLEEAAGKYAAERIGNQYPLLSEFRRRALATHDNFALEEAFADGAEYGYKEAISQAKEWLSHFTKVNVTKMAIFDMEEYIKTGKSMMGFEHNEEEKK